MTNFISAVDDDFYLLGGVTNGTSVTCIYPDSLIMLSGPG